MEGWFKLHRKIMENPIFSDADLLRLWIFCLSKATYKHTKVMIDKQEVELHPGQFVTGRFALFADYNLGVSPRKKVKDTTLWSWLKRLETYGNIDIKTTNKYSVVTILKWHEYQETLTTEPQQIDNKLTADCCQTDTNKKLRSEELKPNVDSSECDLAFERFYKLYPCKNGNKKKTITKWKTLWKNKKIDIDKVISGTNGYIAYVDYRRKNGFKDLNYKNAETFVGNECWNDDYTINSTTGHTYKPTFEKIEIDPIMEAAYAKRLEQNT